MSVQKDFSNAGQNSGSLTIRFSRAEDLPAVLKFYNDNPHPHVDNRGEAVFKDRVEAGRALIVFKPDGEIGMCSMAHPFTAAGEKSGNATWTEIGSTLANLDGFGLYPFVIAAQVVQEFFTAPPEDQIFACIYKDNQAVTNMLSKKVGWDIIEPTEEFAVAVGEKPETMGNLNWLRAHSHSLPHQARIVSEMIQKGYAENKRTGEKLALDLSNFALAMKFNGYLEELAKGELGETLQDRPAQPLRQARDEFEEGLFRQCVEGRRSLSFLKPSLS